MGLSSLSSMTGIPTSSGGIVTSLLGATFSPELVNISKDILNFYDKDYKYNFEIKDVTLQTSTYGRIIPEIFGKMRVSGNIIWTSGIKKETSQTASSQTKDGQTVPGEKSVNYSSSLAIAICKGEAEIENIYADDALIHQNEIDISIYKGDENQLPNPTIQSYKGFENTPAFRGLCYVVIRNFSLNRYDGRIPNFSFDVVCKKSLENQNSMIKSICVIPGSGEFVYDTKIQYKMKQRYLNGVPIGYEKSEAINQNNAENKSDAILGFEKMCKDLPNLEYISLVCSWFGSNLDIKNCSITPKVEYKNAKTTPDEYSVAGKNRDQLEAVSRDENNNLRYGGTPSDSSILRYVENAKIAGKKICFYPMLMIDVPGKPWRGNLSGNFEDIENFFTKLSGYRKFILHYANLLQGKIDALIIGSEMKNLTKIQDGNGNFKAVDELVKLAIDAKNILGNNVKVTYAADWSEYHHTDGGWFNMDKLWACPAIDCIGIDAYFPLTNSSESVYDNEIIKQAWQSGEGFDFYYQDSMNKVNPHPLSPDYAWKNIKHFWENFHTNPNGIKTAWQPKMKKIWFTEFGFPSVDCATNEPNVFFSSGSQDSGFPRLSKGNIDTRAQKVAIFSSLEYFNSCEFLERAFLWTYDARPYPYFPNKIDIWSDGESWKYGHFINGKLTKNSISEMIEYICLKSGLEKGSFEIINLDFDISGIVINNKTNGFELIKMLAEIYEFDIILRDNKIIFQKQNAQIIEQISQDKLIVSSEKILQNSTIKSKDSLVNSVELLFINSSNYRINTALAKSNGQRKYSLKLPIAMTENDAHFICGKILYNLSSKENEYELTLPLTYSFLSISDVISIEISSGNFVDIKIDKISFNFHSQFLTIFGQNFNINLTKKELEREIKEPSKTPIKTGNTEILLHQISNHLNPNFIQNRINISCGINGAFIGWNGVDLYLKNDESLYEFILNAEQESITGKVVKFEQNNKISRDFFDKTTKITILLNDDFILKDLPENPSKNENFALIGNEIIRYKIANFIDDKVYEISNLQRGCFQTKIEEHLTDKNFILISSMKTFSVPSTYLEKEISITPKTYYQSINNATEHTFTLQKRYQELIQNFEVFMQKNGDYFIKIYPKFMQIINFWNGISSFSNLSLVVLNENSQEIYSNDNIFQNFIQITKENLKIGEKISQKYVSVYQNNNIIY